MYTYSPGRPELLCAALVNVITASSKANMCERGVVDMKYLLRLVAVVIMLSCFALPGRGQTSSGTISGHLIDQSGGAVTNAEVRLINQATNVVVTAQVRPNGDFIFPDVQPGTFTVVVQ